MVPTVLGVLVLSHLIEPLFIHIKRHVVGLAVVAESWEGFQITYGFT